MESMVSAERAIVQIQWIHEAIRAEFHFERCGLTAALQRYEPHIMKKAGKSRLDHLVN